MRARWIPVPLVVPARQRLRAEAWTCTLVTLVGVVTLALLAGVAALTDPSLWVFAGTVALVSFCSAARALAKRGGYDRRGFLLEWALPLRAIAGTLLYAPISVFMASCGVSFDI